jgi:7-carboxy-7-deazaguanine synthase
MLNISEIFFSIQGESTYTGLPCIFVRLAGCNLRCNYCDTNYSYKSEITLSINDIITKVKEYDPVKLVEITGGEPLMQPEVFQLIRLLYENDHTLEFINKEKDQIKFVLSDNFDYNWAKDFVMKYNLIDYEILFSPVLEKLEPQKLAKWITDDKLNVRMQLQLHKLIWGKDRKGV